MEEERHQGAVLRLTFSLWVASLLGVLAVIGLGHSLPRGAEIVYTASRTEHGYLNSWIALLDVNHDLTTPLTPHQYNAAIPAWSPDGTLIAFGSDRSGLSSLSIMDASGGHLMTTPTHLNTFGNVDWLADSNRVIFRAQASGTGLFNIASGESSVLNITGNSTSPISWSPDSKHVMYVSYEPDGPHLLMVNIACVTQKSECPPDESPSLESLYVRWPLAWSPDGRWLVFTGLNSHNDTELYLVGVDCGSEAVGCMGSITQLTHNQSEDFAPAWSPDGRSLAFLSDRDGKTSIYLMDMQTRGVRRLNEENFDSRNLVWSGDSRLILLASIQEGQSDIYLVDTQTGATSRLTADGDSSIDPAWRP